MPYSKWSEVNKAIRGIEPQVTLSQANLIAKWADAMEEAEDGPESPWGAAIAQFKKLYKTDGGKWVKKAQASQQDGPARCVCPECGYKQDKERGVPCRSIECPECGESLVADVSANALQFAVNQIAAVHKEKVDGVEYLVAPCVAIREGVLNGEYVPADEIDKHFSAWNGRPFVIGHPKDEDGNDVSANDPETLARFAVGNLFNVRFDGEALKGEIWLDAEKAGRTDDGKEVLKRLESGQPLEISTAYFRDREEKGGTFRGQRYEAVARNLGPDHLAALLDAQGACSWQDGCGAPRVNEEGNMSICFNTIHGDDDELAVHFSGSPRNPYGTHASKGYAGGHDAWIKAWRIHLSKIGGGSTGASAMGPLRGTQRRIAMIAKAMSPACSIPMEVTSKRGGAKSPLSGDFKETPKDYGLSRWKKPADDNLEQTDVAFTCQDLKDLKRLVMEEINRRIADREKNNILKNALRTIAGALNINIGGDTMSKEEMVALVVAALGLTEEQANALEEDVLTQLSAHAEGLQAQENDDDELQEQEEPESSEEEPQANAQPCAQEITALLEALKEVGGADKAAALLKGLKANEDARKQSLVSALEAETACAFSKERLAQMSVEDLETLQRSLKPADYGGRGSGAVYNVRDANPLKMPDIFAKPEVN